MPEAKGIMQENLGGESGWVAFSAATCDVGC